MKIQEAASNLKDDLENKSYVLDVLVGSDSGGYLIEVIVNNDTYPKSDPIDRIFCGFPVCIVKVPPRKKKKELS